MTSEEEKRPTNLIEWVNHKPKIEVLRETPPSLSMEEGEKILKKAALEQRISRRALRELSKKQLPILILAQSDFAQILQQKAQAIISDPSKMSEITIDDLSKLTKMVEAIEKIKRLVLGDSTSNVAIMYGNQPGKAPKPNKNFKDPVFDAVKKADDS